MTTDKNNNVQVQLKGTGTKAVQSKHNKLQVTVKRTNHPKPRKVTKNAGEGKLRITLHNTKPIEPLYEDNRLSQIIQYFNEHLRWQNPIKTPNFLSDIVAAHKNKTCSRTKYKKNYIFFHDGIHPNRVLSKLWLYRILKFASEVQR